MVSFARIFRHLMTPPWLARRRFPARALRAIQAAVAASEATHAGELRFVVEAALAPGSILRGQSARERAVELFSSLRVWDTEGNSGVLIYLLLADRDVEIVADRGIAARVPQSQWEAICRRMEARFRAGDFEGGALAAIGEVGALLAAHFPAAARNPNELPDRPTLL